MIKENRTIENFLNSYREAFVKSDFIQVVSLYTNNGTHLPANRPTVKGHEQLKKFYEFFFKSFQIKYDFDIVEIVESGDYAFVQTTSTGTVHIIANDEDMPLNNKEVFILKNENGTWKISTFIFNQTK